jgi:hypothetical protein
MAEQGRDCGCKAYQDIYTYNRWLAQGYQVQRGQRALRLPLIKEVEEVKEGEAVKTKKVMGMSFVFCRCQVAPVNGNGRKPEAVKSNRPASQPVNQPQVEPSQVDTIMANFKEV